MISVVATALFLYIIYDMLAKQSKARNNIWRTPQFFMDTNSFIEVSATSPTLEWTLPTPTPYHAYHMIPVQS
jgi:hypothetical protein